MLGDARKMRLTLAEDVERSSVPTVIFANYEAMWKTLTPNRMAVLMMMAGAAPMTLGELARRLGRNAPGVRSDVHLLLNSGVIDKTEQGLISFPYDVLHIDFEFKAAA